MFPSRPLLRISPCCVPTKICKRKQFVRFAGANYRLWAWKQNGFIDQKNQVYAEQIIQNSNNNFKTLFSEKAFI